MSKIEIILCVILVLMNTKWIFIILMFPWMVLDKYRDKGTFGYVASLPYRACEKMLMWGNALCYIQYWNYTIK